MAVRVFISSRIDGMKRQRQAARLAIESLDQKAVMAEDFAASAATPRGACLQGVRDADVVVLLLGKSYGQTHESDISATEEEIDETRRLGKPVLAFLTSDERDGKQEEFLQRISGWSTGALHKAPGSLAELQKEIVRALRQATAAPPRADQNALVQQNLDLVTPRVQQGVFQDIGPWIAVSSAPSTDLALDEDQFFAEAAGKICDLCVTGTARLLEQRPRAKAESARLVFLHRQTSGHGPALLARVGLAGDMAVGTSFRNGNRTGAAGFLIASPTDAQKKFAHILSFMGRALDVLDPDKRAQTGLMQASLSNLGMAAFMEPSEDRGMGIPLNVRGREFLSLAPERPEPVSRTELRADGALPHRYIQRFLREARDSRHTGM